MTQVNDYNYTDTRTVREAMIDTISDLSKEVYGFRWRYNWEVLTDEDMQREYEFLSKENNRVFQESLASQKAADNRFDSSMRDWMVTYKISRKDALRWMMQSENFKSAEIYSERENAEHFLFNLGLSSKKINEELVVMDFDNIINFGY